MAVASVGHCVNACDYKHNAMRNKTLTCARERLQQLNKHNYDVIDRVLHAIDAEILDQLLGADVELALRFSRRVSGGQGEHDGHEVEAVGAVIRI